MTAKGLFFLPWLTPHAVLFDISKEKGKKKKRIPKYVTSDA